MDEKEIKIYLDGEKLYGDDFSLNEIKEWYNDEKKGYFNLIDKPSYKYGYHALNYYHGFRYIPTKTYEEVLGFGSAYGDEFKPIMGLIKDLKIVEHADFSKKDVFNVPTEFIKPKIQGDLPFNDNFFDLITCFGVLHHIPNISYVFSEFYRCLKTGGFALVREPIISMGNWNKSRQGLSKRERGIPIPIFRKMITHTGFKILHENLCIFPLIGIINSIINDTLKINMQCYNSSTLTNLDRFLSQIMRKNYSYTSNHRYILAPSSCFYVLQK